MNAILVKSLLTLGIIGFITYLFIVVASFFGCCAGIEQSHFHFIVIGISILGAVGFGACLYNNLCKYKS